MPWDCKLTPADCTCQEGNTTGCIPSNDGLGAWLRTDFPHCGKSVAVAISWERQEIPLLGPHPTAAAGVAVESLTLRSGVSVVPPGPDYYLSFDEPSSGSAGFFMSVPPGPGSHIRPRRGPGGRTPQGWGSLRRPRPDSCCRRILAALAGGRMREAASCPSASLTSSIASASNLR